MLARLEVQGLALLSDVRLALRPGLNVLTGETGAGKSLLVNALGLLLGLRGHSAQVRAGSETAQVHAQFEVKGTSELALLQACGIDGGSIELTRELRANGRGRCVVNGRTVPLSMLARVGSVLVGFTGQHAAYAAGDGAWLLDTLDEQLRDAPLAKTSGGKSGPRSAGLVVSEYASQYIKLRTLRSELETLTSGAELFESKLSMLREWVEELRSFEPKPAEFVELRERLELLRRSRHFVELGAHVQQVIVEQDASLESEVRKLIQSLTRGGGNLSPLEPIYEELRTALAALERASDAARDLCERAELEPAEHEAIEQRFETYSRLARKLGTLPDELSATFEKLERELSELEAMQARIEPLRVEIEDLEQSARKLALALHEQRVKCAKTIEERVQEELAALKLQGARLSFALEASARELGRRGLTEARVLFSANPGEALGAFERIASGGERSRILLALRCAGALGGAPTLVFDEIDAGVGGAAARAIGERLRKAARGRQVVCITHHASVAAFADAHFRVSKATEKGRTCSTVTELGGEERILELARMLAGDQEPEGARALALSLLRSATTERKHRRAA